MSSSITTPRWVIYSVRYMIGMGLYGFTRGYRATQQWDPSTKQFLPHSYLIGDRICHGIATACFYAIPTTMPWTLTNLVNRVEIHLREWKPEDYPEIYNETRNGYCPRML